jgi:GNAT superfamily N-acetyltransferase
MKIVEASEDLKNQINTFYKSVGYHSDWSSTERAFCSLLNNEVIGSVKVESVHGVSILRGMYLAESIRNKGYGSKFIQFIEPVLNKSISFCMPFSHLELFYSQVGFKKIKMQQLPLFLQKRFAAYENDGYTIIAMQRDVSAI